MNGSRGKGSRIAVLLPCYNEEASIANVVRGFRGALPDADVYVYDNNSTDRTVELASLSGAIVRKEPRQGKGHVVRRMFRDVDADIYLMADGDGTYDASSAHAMVKLLGDDFLDMVVGVRHSAVIAGEVAYRPGHEWGNRFFCKVAAVLFGSRFTDILSGYRVMSRRFVKTFSGDPKGFEIEAQLTVHALEMSLACGEFPTPYYARPDGSKSKLNTYRDGFRILWEIIVLLKEARPLFFFGGMSLLCGIASLILGMPVVGEYLRTGLVPRFPTAILASALGVISVIFLSVGLTLDTVSRVRLEMKRIALLNQRDA